jgi:hypothetical protein
MEKIKEIIQSYRGKGHENGYAIFCHSYGIDGYKPLCANIIADKFGLKPRRIAVLLSKYRELIKNYF